MSRIGRGPGALRRWATVCAGIACLAALPAVAERLPVEAPDLAPAEVLDRVARSAGVTYTGYAEAAGRVSLPRVRQAEQLFDLLGGVTKLRVWWRGPAAWRVDAISPVGERGSYRTPEGLLVWDSYERRATWVEGHPEVRLPRAADLLPPELGRRLAALADPARDRLTALRPRRIAGRAAVGVRVEPAGDATTVGRVDVWADPHTGLPLAVELTARGAQHPVVASRFLELSLGRPDPAPLRFTVPADAEYDVTSATDPIADYDNELPFLLPDDVAGRRVRGAGDRIAATYGEGYGIVAVAIVPPWIARRIRRALDGPPAYEVTGGYGTARVVTTSLLSGLVAVDPQYQLGVVVSGAVPVEVLESVAADVVGRLQFRGFGGLGS